MGNKNLLIEPLSWKIASTVEKRILLKHDEWLGKIGYMHPDGDFWASKLKDFSKGKEEIPKKINTSIFQEWKKLHSVRTLSMSKHPDIRKELSLERLSS